MNFNLLKPLTFLQAIAQIILTIATVFVLVTPHSAEAKSPFALSACVELLSGLFEEDPTVEETDEIILLGTRIRPILANQDPITKKHRRLSLGEINRTFGLKSKTGLKFIGGILSSISLRYVENYDLKWNVNIESEKYHRALANGKVYITSEHDYLEHAPGFIRLAKTKAWRDMKQLLRELYRVIDSRKTSDHVRREAYYIKNRIADQVESVTNEITELDSSPTRIEEEVKRFQSIIDFQTEQFNMFVAEK